MNKRIRKKKEKQGKYRHRIVKSGIWEWTYGYKLVDATLDVLIDGKYIPAREALPTLEGRELIGDGFYCRPANRYMGIANRSTSISCETCIRDGMCQYCANRWLIPNKGGQ